VNAGMNAGIREIYAFPSGQLLAEHCAAFAAALAQVWPDLTCPAAVVFQRHGEPVQAPDSLGASAYDGTQSQGVLSYASASELLAHLQPLLLSTDPELLLLHRGAFPDVVERAAHYADRELLPDRPRGLQAWLARVQRSALVEHYAPVIAHGPDGRCFAVERAS
jgi:hypothetical protein